MAGMQIGARERSVLLAGAGTRYRREIRMRLAQTGACGRTTALAVEETGVVKEPVAPRRVPRAPRAPRALRTPRRSPEKGCASGGALGVGRNARPRQRESRAREAAVGSRCQR